MIDLTKIIAPANFAPDKWQTASAKPTGLGGWSKPAVQMSPDLARVNALPRRLRPEGARAEAMVELLTSRYARDNPSCNCQRPCITRLRLIQAWALYEVGLSKGLLGAIGVGHGKTLLDILAPMALGVPLTLLLIPPSLVGQLIEDYQHIGQHFYTPSLVVHGRNFSTIHSGQPTLHVYTYSKLSRSDATDFLRKLAPDAIIADECHKLRHAGTATTSRVLRYFRENPGTKFCGWSGSITDSSVQDYAHISALALREGSPLPIDKMAVDDWARALDPGDFPAPAGPLLMLCKPGEHISDGFHRRLVETQGVVSTTTSAIDATLDIREREAPTIPKAIREAMATVRKTWVRPDGEELVDGLSLHRALRELACGFYYRWIFPRGESPEQIDTWVAARKAWRKELRGKLWGRTEHLDSPFLCAKAAIRYWEGYKGPLPTWKSETWPRWLEVRDTVRPETEAVRVDPYLAEDAAQWAHSNRGIVWYELSAFGHWVAEISGLPLHAGGSKAGEKISAEKGDRSIVASLKSHGTGRNGLQYLFSHQLVANPPSSATAWEQMLGRLHRIGQESDTVLTEFYRHTPELRAHVDQAIERALYVERTLGADQKLRIGWNDLAV